MLARFVSWLRWQLFLREPLWGPRVCNCRRGCERCRVEPSTGRIGGRE